MYPVKVTTTSCLLTSLAKSEIFFFFIGVLVFSYMHPRAAVDVGSRLSVTLPLLYNRVKDIIMPICLDYPLYFKTLTEYYIDIYLYCTIEYPLISHHKLPNHERA